MTLRVLPGGDARADLGYDDAPRLRARPAGRPTRWEFIEVDGAPSPTEAGPIGGVRICRTCRESAPVLHADPQSTAPARVLCGRCTGAVLRERIGWAQAAEPKEPRR